MFVVSRNGLALGPGELQDDKRVLEEKKNEIKSCHRTDLI